jgi:hypothetical protein
MTPPETPIHIDWAYPQPKNALDRFIGPGATRAEVLLQFVPTVLIALGVVALAVIEAWGWTPLQTVVAFVLVLDLVGGVVTNATSSAKRWYHRAGQGFIQHMRFVLLHIVQILLAMLVFDPGNWAFVLGGYGYLVLAAVLILRTPLYLQHPLAGLLLVIGILLALYGLPVPAQLAWFLPIYYLKLLVCHLLRQEPYRP